MALDIRQGRSVGIAIKSLIFAKGNVLHALHHAEGQGREAQGASAILRKGVVPAMGASGAGFGDHIDGSEIMSLVRPLEILGRLSGTRRVPFNVRLNSVSIGTSAQWTEEGQAIALSKQTYAGAGIHYPKKVVAMCATSQELAEAPGAEVEFTRDLTGAIVLESDRALVDPNNAGSDARPASVLNGAPTHTLSAATAAALDTALTSGIQTMVALGSNLQFVSVLVHPATLAAISLLRDSGGGLSYPGLSLRTGGTLAGLPVIASAAVPHDSSPLSAIIALIDGSRIWVSDDNDIRVAIAKAATLQMSDAPTQHSVDATATTQTSMFQTHSVCVRATRMLNFSAASGAAVVLNGVAW